MSDAPNPATERDPENLKIATGAVKPPLGIVPMAALVGVSRVLEDGGAKYSPGNYIHQGCEAALASYDSAQLRHRMLCQPLSGIVSPSSYAALDDDSGLPHIDHMIAGLLILRTLMIRDGILPTDPGVGKRKAAKDKAPPQVHDFQRVTRTDPMTTVERGAKLREALDSDECDKFGEGLASAAEIHCYESCPYQDGGCNGCDHPERDRLRVERDAEVFEDDGASNTTPTDADLDMFRMAAVDANLKRLQAEARQATADKERRDREMGSKR